MSEAYERIYDEVWARDTAARLTDEQIVRYIYAPNSAHLSKAIRSRLADRIEALEREVKELRADIETFWKPQFDEQVERAEAAEAREARYARAALTAKVGRS